MATPTRCPQLLLRFPPSSRIAAPTTGKASSSHAARCAPTAVSELMTAADGAAATEPVTGYLPSAVLAPGQRAPGEGLQAARPEDRCAYRSPRGALEAPPSLVARSSVARSSVQAAPRPSARSCAST